MPSCQALQTFACSPRASCQWGGRHLPTSCTSNTRPCGTPPRCLCGDVGTQHLQIHLLLCACRGNTVCLLATIVPRPCPLPPPVRHHRLGRTWPELVSPHCHLSTRPQAPCFVRQLQPLRQQLPSCCPLSPSFSHRALSPSPSFSHIAPPSLDA